MKVMISNDRSRLYASIDYDQIDKTRLASNASAGATTITVLNATGWAANDFVMVGDPGSETSEIVKIQSMTDFTATLTSVLKFDHKDKIDKCYRLEYDQVVFYEGPQILNTNRYDENTYADSNYTAIAQGTISLKADFYTSMAYTVNTAKSYCVAFKNSVTSKISPLGEKVNGYEHLLCSPGDLRQHDNVSTASARLLDKIDVATGEIIRSFQTQKQDYSNLTNRDILRTPCALLALHYIFNELAKEKDDIPSKNASDYLNRYKASIKEVSDYINVTEQKVSVFGQTRCER